jgi:hypothetical protein
MGDKGQEPRNLDDSAPEIRLRAAAEDKREGTSRPRQDNVAKGRKGG